MRWWVLKINLLVPRSPHSNEGSWETQGSERVEKERIGQMKERVHRMEA